MAYKCQTQKIRFFNMQSSRRKYHAPLKMPHNANYSYLLRIFSPAKGKILIPKQGEKTMKKETEKLLRECTSGLKMGEHALGLAISQTKNSDLKSTLEDAIKTHAIISDEARKMLFSAHKREKEPSPLLLMMSDTKMKARMMINGSSATIASLITDGCNMGAKTISHYLNIYSDASDQAKSLANRIITAEDDLRHRLRSYL